MSQRFQPTPRQARALSLDRNLSVVAGAGTGKTAVLSDRYLRILSRSMEHEANDGEDGARPDQIVAVTYTRKAAQEMRDRIREKLKQKIDDARTTHNPTSMRHWTRMRRHLVDAPITTIHGLATFILREHALDADMDPDFGIIQGGEEALLRTETVERTLRSPPDDCLQAIQTLYRLYPPTTVQQTVEGLLQDRARADQWATAMAEADPDELYAQLVPMLLPFTAEQAETMLAEAQQLLTPLVQMHPPGNGKGRDKLIVLAKAVVGSAPETLEAKAATLWQIFDHFTTKEGQPYSERGASGAIGSMAEWKDWGGIELPRAILEQMNEWLAPLVGTFDGPPGEADRTMLHTSVGLAAAYRHACSLLDAEKERRGVLDFHDLETRAAKVMSSPGVADALRRRWRYILVDEFQDTNDAQWEIIRALGGAPLISAVDAANTNSEAEEAALAASAFQSAASYFDQGPSGIPPQQRAPTSSQRVTSAGDEAARAARGATNSNKSATSSNGSATGDAQVPDAEQLLQRANEEIQHIGRDRVFIVGDAKQSIYGFRGAQLPVYQRSRQQLVEANNRSKQSRAPLPSGSATGTDPETPEQRAGEIELDRNFRSLPNVVRFTNAVCKELLAPEDPSLPRLDEAQPGPLTPHREPLPNMAGRIDLLVSPHKLENAVQAGLLSEQEAERRTLGDVTAAQLATDIQRRVAGDFGPISGKGGPRNPHYGDIAILMPARTRLPAILRALRSHKIPYVVTGGRGFWRRQEVWDLVNLLAFLANPQRSIELVGILRSPLFAWTDDAITRLMAHEAPGNLARLKNAAQDVTLLGPTANKCGASASETWNRITHWRTLGSASSAAGVLDVVLSDSAYLAAYHGHADAGRIVANVEQFVEIVRGLERTRPRHLGGLVRDLEHLIDTEADQSEADPIGSAEADAVRIMTIHAAKGLEFPVVYVVEMGALRGKGSKGAGVARGNLGAVPLLSHRVLDATGERMDPILHKRLKKEQKQRERLESKRLVYVALTRAKDHLVLAGCTPRAFDPAGKAKPAPAIAQSSTWMDWLESILGLDPDAYADVLAGTEALTITDASYHVRMPTPTWPSDTPQAGHREGAVPELVYAAEPLANREQTRSLVLAPSRLELHRLCAARFRYAVIEGLPDRALRGVGARVQSPGQVFGTLVHRILAERGDRAAQDWLPPRIQAAALEMGLSASQLTAQVDTHASNAEANMGAWNPAERDLHEVAVDVNISPSIRLVGTLDHVRVQSDQTLVVTDYKTDTTTGQSTTQLLAHAEEAGYLAQVNAYAAALGPDASGALLFTGRGHLLQVPPGDQLSLLTKALEQDLAIRMNTGLHDSDREAAFEQLWPRNIATSKACDSCPYFSGQGGPCNGKSEA